MKPNVSQVAWVFKKILEATNDHGSFRYMIYDKMKFRPEVYMKLWDAGGQEITNTFHVAEELRRPTVRKVKSSAGTYWGTSRCFHPHKTKRAATRCLVKALTLMIKVEQ